MSSGFLRGGQHSAHAISSQNMKDGPQGPDGGEQMLVPNYLWDECQVDGEAFSLDGPLSGPSEKEHRG